MKKIVLSLTALAVVFGIPVLWFWYSLFGPGYYTEFNDIKAQFERLPSVEVVRMGGNEDITYEDIWAEIDVQQKGRIELFALTRKSFHDVDHLSLGTIKQFNIVVEGEGYVGVIKTATGEPVRSRFYGGSVDIGRKGTFAQFFPFQMNNVQDIIARYDEISAIIASWPVEPEKRHFKDEEGTDYYYYVKKIQQDESTVPSEAAPSAPSEVR